MYDLSFRHCYGALQVNRQTRKYYFTTTCIVVAAIFKNSVSRLIPKAVDKINKIGESGSPRSGVNEVFAGFLQQ